MPKIACVKHRLTFTCFNLCLSLIFQSSVGRTTGRTPDKSPVHKEFAHLTIGEDSTQCTNHTRNWRDMRSYDLLRMYTKSRDNELRRQWFRRLDDRKTRRYLRNNFKPDDVENSRNQFRTQSIQESTVKHNNFTENLISRNSQFAKLNSW